jgi:hypothetical protein
MKYLNNQSGSMLSLAAGLISILVFTVMGALNVSYLVSQRFQLQSDLDALALQLVQQIDYENYFEVGFSDALNFDLVEIDRLTSLAVTWEQFSNCQGPQLKTAVIALEVKLELQCPVGLPFALPGLPPEVQMEVGASARLAQAGG